LPNLAQRLDCGAFIAALVPQELALISAGQNP
jgi:hypothetical protein